jgi:hypothetical protein
MTSAPRIITKQQLRAFWLKHLHQWHWMSAATCLVGMILFSITGFTLNHANWIGADPEITTTKAQLPDDLLTELRSSASDAERTGLAAAVQSWLSEELSVDVMDHAPEWSEDEVYVSLPRPGGDAWLSIDLESGEILHEKTDRGWLAYFNDLHKGRNAGRAWSLFIDVFAFATLLFATTGLLLLKMHAGQRRATWPMVGLGMVAPLLLALLFIH